jgi:thiamine biosynthesis protein ThiS
MGMVTINGTAQHIEDGTTVFGYLREKGIDPDHVVAEVNGTIVPKDRFATSALKAGDTLEIIRFVGGG